MFSGLFFFMMIQALIPIALMAIGEQLEKETEGLAGMKYGRQGGMPGL
jgi:hypothetical protein